MLVIWLGALSVVAGLLYMATSAIWKGPMSGSTRIRTGAEPGTLEPPDRGITIFSLSGNWPGLALMVIGAVLLLAGLAV